MLAVAGAWLLWPSGHRPSPVVKKSAAAAPVASVAVLVPPANALTKSVAAGTNSLSTRTNRFAFRLANTAKTIGQLASDRHAILLDNALIETDAKMNLKIPAHLRAAGDPGAFIVQARGVISAAFRAALAAAGGQIVSYIPNNAYLVQLDAAGAGALAGNPLVQAVLPYDPYYKVQSSLLGLAVNQKPLPDNTYLTLGLFSGSAAATEAQIQSLGGVIMGTDRSPFGPVLHVQPPDNWIALAQLPGVQIVEPAHRRVTANDLSRQSLGVALNSIATTNYLNLTGTNVLVEVNDTGIDTNQPDLAGRVFLDAPGSGYDTDGHGTFVAGQIAGSGLESITVTNAQGSIMPGTSGQFRGMAPAATLFSVGGVTGYSQGGLTEGGNDTNFFVIGQTNFFLPGAAIYLLGPTGETNYFYAQFPDWYLQEAPAATNALISNNSWNNDGAADYDLAAAGYDAAVRDALPEVTGPQPVLFVFSAGNDGGGNDYGQDGNSDSILSPATAKNVITVGALEQYRNITNTYLPFGSTNPSAYWQPEMDSSSQVAAFSARGNVGIGTEGAYGRFKPDVVAPGTGVVSTRSTTWDQVAYYNPTNFTYNTINANQLVDTNYFNFYSMQVPSNAVGVVLYIEPNNLSPVPFPNLNIVWTATNSANLDPTDPTTYDGSLTSNTVAIPPNGNLANIIGSGNLYFAVSDTTSIPVEYNLVEEIITTNAMGNFYEVYSNLNNSLGSAPYYYRYESGTSMAAADVSGVLALMQDYFTNTLHITPSPALLKAMLINGARLDGDYTYAVTNSINLEGWGLVNLPNSIPATLTNSATSTNSSLFFADQSPTNALATGDSLTYNVTVPAAARGVHLRVTLAWTDPPGNPAAAIKLVNSLELVVTNLGTGKIYYGNNFNPTDPLGSSQAFATNGMPVTDAVNNVQNVIIPPNLDTNYSVTIVGRSVNVNAVTTQATNIAQDFALVISGDDGGSTNGISVAATASAPAPSLAPQVTVVGTTNQPYFDQIVGANAPLLSTNTIGFGPNSPYATNAVLTIGQTNQWHFYVVTNMTTYTNAAFITFIPSTLAIPRMGVFAGSDANSTLPEANLDLYVAGPGDPNAASLTNLDPVVISNCMFGINGDSAALARGGTKFVVYTNSTQNQIYYVGVKCEDQMGGEYAFLPAFSPNAFSTQDTNGNVYVTALNTPLDIPDGNNQHPGVGYVFGLAVPNDPTMTMRNVIVSNTVTHENFGDLVGYLSHGENYVTLNNHDELGWVDQQLVVYDDGVTNETPGAQHTDGPGSLNDFRGQHGIGPWFLTEMDEAYTQTGRVDSLTIKLEPHIAKKNTGQQTVTVPAGGWFYDYVDVPVGYTNLTVTATNITIPPGAPPVQLYLNYPTEPTISNNLAEADLIGGPLPGAVISYGPPLTPGRYYIGLFNPDSLNDQTVLLGVNLAFSSSAETVVDYDSTGAVPLLDDAVTYAYLDVTNADVIQGISVGLRVDHSRISDLVFHLISPDGTRYLLMENRGADSTNGCGADLVTTNVFHASANGNGLPTTNVYNIGKSYGTIPITYNFYTVPDQMTVYYGTNPTPILDFTTGNPPGGGGKYNTLPEITNVYFPPPGYPTNSTYLTVIMNKDTNAAGANGTEWTYSVGTVATNFVYLSFTEDTNLTTTPIKFAPPPFVPQTNFTPVLTDSFEAYTPGTYPPNNFASGWVVATNSVEIITNLAFDGTNSLQLSNGVVAITVATVTGRKYNLTYEQDSASDVSNANWQAQNYSFTATDTNTTLVLAATTNVLTGLTFTNPLEFTFDTNTVLDDLVLTELPANLYYQAEQDISGLTGNSAYGTMANGHPWQLEILDNRAGATNTAATLLGWELEFTFANTNPPVATTNTLVGGIAQINTVASNTVANNSIVWYAVTVPIKASQATNLLLFATGPVNVWFSTNVPPSIVDAGDTNLISGQTNGISILTTNTASWPYIITNGTYYLGVQNLNTNSVTYGIEVDFDHGNAPGSGLPSLVIGNVKVSGGSVQLSWAATSSAPYVQWKTNLTAAWNTVTNPATATTNGVATFTDNGAQTAPLGPMRFYRLVQVH